MVMQIFTHFLLLISVVDFVVVVVEVGLIGTPTLFRLLEPSAPSRVQFWRAVHLAEAPSRWLQGHQLPSSQPPAHVLFTDWRSKPFLYERFTKSSKKTSPKFVACQSFKEMPRAILQGGLSLGLPSPHFWFSAVHAKLYLTVRKDGH